MFFLLSWGAENFSLVSNGNHSLGISLSYVSNSLGHKQAGLEFEIHCLNTCIVWGTVKTLCLFISGQIFIVHKASTIKLFTGEIFTELLKAGVFAITCHLHPYIKFTSKAGAYLTCLNYSDWRPAFPANIRLRYQWLIVANTLAYYNTAKKYSRKKFYSTGPTFIIMPRILC